MVVININARIVEEKHFANYMVNVKHGVKNAKRDLNYVFIININIVVHNAGM
jgi:hypothetical protein